MRPLTAILTVFFLLLMLPFRVVGSVRLVDGNGPCEGRVEVFYGGQWGTVCDDGWDIADANVVCLQVGCGPAVSAPQRARYGQGSGPIWMDEVYCNERNTRLEECQFGGWGGHNCRHREDASAICEDFPCPDPSDIANGTVSYTGSSLGGTAHYSCDDGFILFGQNVTKCQNNSTWENPPSCHSSAISFQSNQYTAIEGVDESVTITVVRYGDNSSDLCVSISISGGNEVPIGDDVIVENDETTTIVLSVNNTDVGIINNTDAVITILDNDVFDACETRACTDVRIINDNWSENAETFAVSLERNSAQDAWLSIDPAEAEVTILLNDGYSAELTVEIVSAASLKVSWHKNDTDTIASTVKYECATPQTDHIASTIERTLPYPDTSTYFDISFCYYDPEKKYKHTATLLQTSTTPSKEPTLTSNSFYIDYKYFQIQFGPMKLCLDWKVGEQQHIESKVKQKVTDIILEHCSDCTWFSESFIGQGYFLCHDNPNTPTYRSYITTPYPVSTNTNSSDLLAIIENWISSAPIMLFDLLLVKINPRCPIAISSLNEPECF
ncbi:Scavenger receptor cysteine-rich type 1 protein M130 [Geodia barretti]|uniref:Scavenger receptor cysteine-rich type 1 protein M130 n=1 Tax=Geodia barretti TaxID=519541 RepID=A0AA35RQP6_GEOBA|nr:Scavenger receptor cysteine-rich type 1 protein M130 [Geodia barretti]